MNGPIPIQNQAYIDRLYAKLEALDPECRSGELRILPSDTPEMREKKERRIKAYGAACQNFVDICTARVEQIQSYCATYPQITLSPYPDNMIPESDSPMLSAKEYQRLCAQIYSQNQQKIDQLGEKMYGDKKKFPGAITLESIKREFRLVYGTEQDPNPHIIIGWDLDNPQVLYVDTNGMII